MWAHGDHSHSNHDSMLLEKKKKRGHEMASLWNSGEWMDDKGEYEWKNGEMRMINICSMYIRKSSKNH